MIAPGLYIPLSKCIYVWFQNSVVSDINFLDRQEKTNSYRDRFRKEILQLGQCLSPESFTSTTRASYRIFSWGGGRGGGGDFFDKDNFIGEWQVFKRALKQETK